MKDIHENLHKRINMFKEKPVFYVDFDNTLWNTQKVYVETYNDLLKQDANWEDNMDWNFKDVCPIVPYKGFESDMFSRFIWEMIDDKYYHPDISIGDYYYDGAVDFINRMVEVGEVILLTVGSDANIYNKGKYVEKTLSKKLGKLYIAMEDAFHLKSRINMENAMIIDDRTDILKASNALYKVRFGKQFDWNRDWNPNGVDTFSCETWEDVHKLVRRLRDEK